MTTSRTATAKELATLLEIMEDAYWRLKDLSGDPELSEGEEGKIDGITTNLDEYFA